MGLGGSDVPETPQIPTQDLQNVATNPVTSMESVLFTPSGKACCWKDSEEFAFRLRQLSLINHAITVLLRETWKDVNAITSFQTIHRDVMTMLDTYGNPDAAFPWSILSEDPLFTPQMEMDVNRFKEFEHYFLMNGGVSKEQIKKDFENYIVVFTRLRSWLMSKMAEFCSVTQTGGRWVNNMTGGSNKSKRTSCSLPRKPISRITSSNTRRRKLE